MSGLPSLSRGTALLLAGRTGGGAGEVDEGAWPLSSEDEVRTSAVPKSVARNIGFIVHFLENRSVVAGARLT
jgi:hypothetical protein